MKTAALEAASQGFRVFPVAAGQKKPPLIEQWPKRASADPGEISRWWSKWPNANIGAATGAGRLVVDSDPRHGGELAPLGLPESWHSQTPGRGEHVWLGYSAALRVGSDNTGKIAPGVDVKADGGYVVLPPSTRADGSYCWLAGYSPADLPMAFAPAGLLALLVEAPSDGHHTARPASYWARLLREPIPDGRRNGIYVQLIGHWLRLGFGAAEALENLRLVNALRAQPPAPDADLIERVEWCAGREFQRRRR